MVDLQGSRRCDDNVSTCGSTGKEEETRGNPCREDHPLETFGSRTLQILVLSGVLNTVPYGRNVWATPAEGGECIHRMHFMKHLTVRNLPSEVVEALDRERRRIGLSLNQTVVQLLQRALGIGAEVPPSNGLRRLAGSWSEEEFAEFERAVTDFERVDEDAWQ
jgi:hypothetical protein